MLKNNDTATESDLPILMVSGEVYDPADITAPDDTLQRNDDWNKARNGNWNGSERKDLMACNRSAAKLTWNDYEKVFMFSDGIVKLIYKVAMKRKTQKVITGATTSQMRYGTKVEPLILLEVVNWAKKHYPAMTVKPVGYKTSDVNDNSGSSSDSIIGSDLKGPQLSVEAKACCSWDAHYERTFELMDEKSSDFWQTQAQMEAWGVDMTIYAVAEPPEDITPYLATDDIFSMSDRWRMECPVTFQKVPRSEVHQQAMSVRISIVEETISRWTASTDKASLRAIFYNVLSEYKTKYRNSMNKIPTVIMDLVQTTDEIKDLDTTFEMVSPVDEPDLDFNTPETKEKSFEDGADDRPF